MNTATKLGLGFGLLLLLLVGIGLFVAHRLALIDRALTTIMAVQDPPTSQSFELALNVSDTRAAVLRELTTARNADYSSIVARYGAFRSLVGRYATIARTDSSRAIGRRMVEAHAGFAALADSLLTQSDARRALVSDFARASEALEEVFRKDLVPLLDGKGKEGPRKIGEAAALEADAAALSRTLGVALRLREPEPRGRIQTIALDFQQRLARYHEMKLGPEELEALSHLQPGFDEVVARGHAAFDAGERMNRTLDRFLDVSKRLELLIADGIQSLSSTDVVEAQHAARRAIRVGLIAVLVMLVAGIIVGGSTALPVTRSVVAAEQRMDERMRELSIAHERKDEFLSVLAHELRNPLAPLSNALHVLEARAEGTPPEERQAHAMMRRQVQNMSRLVDDLLDTSRISQGKIVLRREPVELNALVAEAAEDAEPLARARSQSLRLTPSAQPVWVHADPTRIAQILGNLLSNAVKYGRDGGRIDLALSTSSSDAIVRVSDDGVGIPKEMLQRVFEPFTQLDPTVTRAQGGLGIGLSLAKRLTEMHGGGIRAESGGTGKGSTFTLRLTRVAAPADAAERVKRGARVSAATGPAADAMRILVVDDNRDSAESLAELLRLWGHDVEVAHDGPAAIELFGLGNPKVVLLDIGLPGMSGYEVARALRERNGDGPRLIALTGLGQEEDRRRAKDAGFDHHLTKPVDPAMLRELIERG